MPSAKKSLSLAEQIAELSNPVPKDFDPEDDHEFDDGSDRRDEDHTGSDAESQDSDAGREHYVAVGKSKLRKNQDLHLDPKYDGAKIDRDVLWESASDSEASNMEGEDEDDDEDEDDNDEDEDSDEDMLDDRNGMEEIITVGKATKLNSSKPPTTDGLGSHHPAGESSDEDDISDENEDQSDLDMEDDGEDDAEAESSEDSNEGNTRRAELKKLMIEDQKISVSNLSKAAKADVDKGLAVRDQRAAFDSFLSSRMKLQKAIIAVNSMGLNQEASDSLKEAEDAALALWNTISHLRQDAVSLRNSKSSADSGAAGKKRKHADISSDTPLSAAWSTLQDLEQSSNAWRNTTLERWSSKLQASTVPLTKKLNQAAAVQTIASQMREHLIDTDRLISRTRVPRGSAPLQAKEKVERDPQIYDDTDFYQVLLKALVDQRMAGDNSTTGGMQWTLSDVAELNTKKKKNVDTKASKGRKLRYHVHEKLQNFMTPENNLEWHEQQIDELFSSILGQSLKVGEESTSEEEEEDEDNIQLSALRLFSSQAVA